MTRRERVKDVTWECQAFKKISKIFKNKSITYKIQKSIYLLIFILINSIKKFIYFKKYYNKNKTKEKKKLSYIYYIVFKSDIEPIIIFKMETTNIKH